jgi:anti-sigma B factor antagonist
MNERSHVVDGLEIQLCGNSEHQVLDLAGELDLASAPELHHTLHRLCGNGTTSIELDLSDVSFIDSTGIRTLLEAQSLCGQHGCSFRIAQTSTAVERLLQLTGLRI